MTALQLIGCGISWFAVSLFTTWAAAQPATVQRPSTTDDASRLAAAGEAGYPGFRPPTDPGNLSSTAGDASDTGSTGTLTPSPLAGGPNSPTSLLKNTKPIEAGQIIARINGEIILAGDVLAQVNEVIEANGDRIPEFQLPQVRKELTYNFMERLIDTKLLYSDFRRNVGDHAEEVMKNIDKQAAEKFDSTRLPKLLEATKTSNRAELDTYLRSRGSSLDDQIRQFKEQGLAAQWLYRQTKEDVTVTREDLLAYYQEHLDDYKYEAKARWEEIMVRFDRFKSKEAAKQRICELGNMVLVRGAKFSDVAKQYSHGTTAEDGGARDWTTKGSLADEVLDRTVFELEVGKLSPVLESSRGYHIIRVVERRDAGRTPFADAQQKIEETLREQQQVKHRQEYLSKLRREARVWTIFDNDKEVSELSQRDDGGSPR